MPLFFVFLYFEYNTHINAFIKYNSQYKGLLFEDCRYDSS